jgi:uncharacterized membrane protein
VIGALPRGLAIALFASLAANLFLAGVMLGDWLRPSQLRAPAPILMPAPPPPAIAQGSPAPAPSSSEPLTRAIAPSAPVTGDQLVRGAVQRMLASLSPEQRPDVERKLAAHRGEIQRANQELRAARQRVHQLAIAPTLDRDALAQAYTGLRERNASLQQAIHTAVLDAFSDLPVDARVRIVNALAPGGRP